LNKYTPYEDRDIDVLYVGRMTENKGPDILLDALLHPEIKSLNIRSCFVGDGPLLEGLNRLAAGTSGIQFVGPQAHAKVLELMDRSRIVVVPSRSLPDGRSEGFGLAAIEGAAAGCRVLVARTGALTETIDASDDDAFEPNPESLAAILKVNLANPTTASERAEMVRKAVCSNLSRGVIGSKWDALYGISTAN
jgi:glycosyltransferase involved in cell wall biosynthesis